MNQREQQNFQFKAPKTDTAADFSIFYAILMLLLHTTTLNDTHRSSSNLARSTTLTACFYAPSGPKESKSKHDGEILLEEKS